MNFTASAPNDNVAIYYYNQHYTYAELQRAIKHMASQLKKLPQGVILLPAHSTPAFIIQLLACFLLKKPVAVYAPAHQLTAQKLFTKALQVNTRGVLSAKYENKVKPPHPETALVLFTSGSSGAIKAVQLSEQNIISNCNAVINSLFFPHVSSQLLFLPLHYSFGLLAQLLPGLLCGISNHLLAHFTEVKSLFEQQQIPQMWSGVPSHWVVISKIAQSYPQSAAAIKAIISAGAHLDLNLRHTLKQTFPNAIIYNNYGLTEAAPRILSYSSSDPLFFESYTGYPVGEWMIKLSGNNELQIKGPQLMLGYLDDSETKNQFEDGWYSTGDLAQINSSGLLKIAERHDTMVKIGGEKWYWSDIEGKINNLDYLNSYCAIIVKDRLYGNKLCVFYTDKPINSPICNQQFADALTALFRPKTIPVTCIYIEKIPLNHKGNADKNALFKFYEDYHENRCAN